MNKNTVNVGETKMAQDQSASLSERELLCLKAQALRQYCLVLVQKKQASEQNLPYVQALGLGVRVLSHHKWGLLLKGCIALLKHYLKRQS